MTDLTTARTGDWMQTYTGRVFYPLDPLPDEVCIEDIAHSLALQCRFAGHCLMPYSVAEHSVRVMQLLRACGKPLGCLQRALLHDASEAYLVDLPRPLKHFGELGNIYRRAEAAVQEAIWDHFGITAADADADPAVKWADDVLLATEARDLMARPPKPWQHLPLPLPTRIVPMEWQDAKARFLHEAKVLGPGR